jgi:hypothetical protein
MNKKKPAKGKKTASPRNLKARTLTAKQARNVKGGLEACATGTHFKEATITH